MNNGSKEKTLAQIVVKPGLSLPRASVASPRETKGQV